MSTRKSLPLRTLLVFAAVLALIPCASSAQPPGQRLPSLSLDLAVLTAGVDPLLRVSGPPGPTTFGFLGTPVAGGLDVDGDGLIDYAVAHMSTSDAVPGRVFSGEVQLVFGNGTVSGAIDLAVPDPRVLRILGGGFFEATGSELWMDDVTGDGLGDLLVHRQNFNPGGRIGAGALTIVVGGPALRALAMGGGVLDLAGPPPAGVRLFTLVGPAAAARLGMWARTGDVDGDGIADFAVAADQESVPGEVHRGAVYVVLGGPHLATTATVDLAGFGATLLAGMIAKITPPPGSGHFHLGSTNQVADLDGNGRGEVMLAAALNRIGGIMSPDGTFTGHAVGGAPRGRLFIVWDDAFPARPWPAGLTLDLGAPPAGTLTTISGGVQNDQFGEEIAVGRDFNGDGRADLFVGDLTGDGSVEQDRFRSGIGYVYYRAEDLKGKSFNVDAPPAGQKITKIIGPGVCSITGDTATHGDFDGDGLDDLVVGNPDDTPDDRLHAGTLNILFGRPGQWPHVIDLAPGRLPPQTSVRITQLTGGNGEITGPPFNAGDVLCYSAATGDVDGDGRDDLITNEMLGDGAHPAAIDAGNLIILSGALLTP